MTIRRIAMQAASGNLTAGRFTTVDANGLLIDGTAILDANSRLLASQMPTKILNSYWHASWDEKTVVAGTWGEVAEASQTDYDDLLVSSAALKYNSSAANNDEIHFGSLTLNAGTYKISFATIKFINRGIIEILLGSTSLGTYDCYNGSIIYNSVGSLTYSPTTRVTGNLRFKVTGKNASSSGYTIAVSRLEIIRTG